MDQGYFWLNDVQFERLEAHLPTDTEAGRGLTTGA